MSQSSDRNRAHDVFISYAREDEASAARPLASAFQGRGLKFWLDRIDLRPGRSIEDDILTGLLGSRYAVVIISKNFLQAQWPKRELDILLTLEEIDQQRKIVIVRHQITEP